MGRKWSQIIVALVSDALLLADINECETGSDNCHENAQCSNTEGNFTCYCESGYTGDGTECSMVLTVGLSSTGILVSIAVLLMIIAIVCGSICVVRKLRKMDAERFVTIQLKCFSYVMCSQSIHTFLSSQFCFRYVLTFS